MDYCISCIVKVYYLLNRSLTHEVLSEFIILLLESIKYCLIDECSIRVFVLYIGIELMVGINWKKC